MVTGEIKNKIDQIWDALYVAGITNPITVLEQMTYIYFMKMLDDKQLHEEANARDWGGIVKNPTFPAGQMWINPEITGGEEAGVPYENLRWHVFKNFGSENMYRIVRQHVFEFIKHIGTTMASVTLDKHETLSEMLKRPEIDTLIDDDSGFERDIHNVKKIGNFASHVGIRTMKKNDSFICLRSLYYVVCGFLYRWKALKNFAPFDATLVPHGLPVVHVVTDDEPQVARDMVNYVPHEVIEHPSKPDAKPVESLESEAITRKCLIDYMLNEAGWDILSVKGDVQGGKACIEVKVIGMPTDSGIGYCDYVLFSKGGQPLAVIEVKSTVQSVGKGRKQAILYADCLERMYGLRPVIYYTNGYTTKVIDGLGYPDREVIAFHGRDDLEYMIQKRGRADITDLAIDEQIVDRPYQKTAIKSVVEWFNLKHRRGLLVLATGTGKTRVSIALCKLLTNNNWIKNVLFLADRTELVKQARGSYENLLPSESMTSLSDDAEPDLDARFVFSTYQTMINYINDMDLKFSVGHFDLIIIDEAHRSVFGKYGAIFQYFDSLLIGLTATPRNEIDKNTFRLLELENEPNFEYTFDEAVKDGFLVPYKVRQYKSKVMSQGIKYNELTEEQREQLEKVWDYEKVRKDIDPRIDYHRDIESGEMFCYLFNDDTIDNVLTELITSGQKVHGNEDIGKTIIFAYNHRHAERIVERFHTLYPERGADYCQLIDNYVAYHDKIIREFKTANKLPQVAVSVDMLDTGIDVSEILNLVFFKKVKSKIKFEQMIGRGTRLCPNIFGKGRDKRFFYIIDWCANFDYFSTRVEDFVSSDAKSLTERLFLVRLDIAKELQSACHQEVEFDRQMHDDLKALLHKQVNSIVKQRKDARKFLNVIEPFRHKERWAYISEVDVLHLKEIGRLIPQDNNDEQAKRFDILILYLQLSCVDSKVHVEQFRQTAIDIASRLEQKGTIPAVREHIDIIRDVQNSQFLGNLSLECLERVRIELRDLIKLLDDVHTQTFVVDIEDSYDAIDGNTDAELQSTYMQRVTDYLAKNTDNATIRKIQNLEQLTSDDYAELERIFFEELGTTDDYYRLTENRPYKNNIAAFVRVISGIDRHKALQIYQHFVDDNNMTSLQERYLKEILDYVSVNGDIETKDFMDYPFSELNWRDTFGDHFIGLKIFVQQIHQVISVIA